MKIKINDHGITAKLKEIRKGMNAHIGEPFVPVRADYRSIDIDISDPESIINGPGPLLVHNGRVVFAYIKDHIVSISWSWFGRGGSQTGRTDPLDPANLRKLHFTSCNTLKQMINEGKFEHRYVVTNRTDNKYRITIGAGRIRSGEREAHLFPCQNCLNAIEYKGFSFSSPNKEKNKAIVKSFDAKDVMKELQHIFQKFQDKTAGLRPDTAPAGYPPNWREISAKFRKRKNYVCDECGRPGNARTTQTHHINSNKSDCDDANLQCLCKDCHIDKHPHMQR